MSASKHDFSKWGMKRRCDTGDCSFSNPLKLKDLYAVMAKTAHGGSRKEAAFICQRCHSQNILQRALLPRNAFENLPSHYEWLSAKTAPPATCDEGKRSSPPQAANNSPPQAKTERTAWQRRNMDLNLPDHTWVKGNAAFKVLCASLKEALESRGDIVALGRSKRGILIPLQLTFARITTDELLSYLDENKVGLLILGGVDAGRPWKIVFHPQAGMASLIPEHL